jgi:uncharacterized protein YrrD
MTLEGSVPQVEGAGAAPMLRRWHDVRRFTIGATDGDIGTVEDLYFDDRSWTVRHIVVRTGGWLSGRSVLLSPHVVTSVDGPGRALLTELTRDQVRHSPDIDASKPVSRQHEVELYQYYGFPFYWTGPYRWGPVEEPSALEPGAYRPRTASGIGVDVQAGDPDLRSVREVEGYTISATDGEFGHVEDFLVDELSWAIRYLLVDTRRFWPGKRVLVSPEWIMRVSWGNRAVVVDVTRDQVEHAPEYDPRRVPDRGFEERVHAAHGRRGYWHRPRGHWRFRPPAA